MKDAERIRAQMMRRSGKSIKTIASVLEVSPSSVSRWCAMIELTPAQKISLDASRREAGLKALAPWVAKNKQQKQSDIAAQLAAGTEDVGNISTRDLFILGLGLYWGEGYKRGSQECGFTNSDPAIVRTILRWFYDCYDIDKARIIARVTINDLYKAEAERIVHDWSKEVQIPVSQFGKPSFISGYGKISRDARTYRGTLRIKVRNGTSLRRRILASLARVANTK